MAVSEMRMHSAWDPRALEDVVQSSCTEAVVVTDKNGRVVYSELRRETPADLGALAELAFAQLARAGDKLGMGSLEVAASLHEKGLLVCGGTAAHTVLVLASPEANLGQILHTLRRMFPAESA